MPSWTSLAFGAPRLVQDEHNASGPWYDGVHRLSDTHALGEVGAYTLATDDAGRTWRTLLGWKNETYAFGGIYSADGTRFHNAGSKITYISPTGNVNVNVTAVTAPQTTRFYLGEKKGSFARSVDRPFRISGLPHISGFRVGSAASSLWLRDGTLLATSVTTGIGHARAGFLSVIALHSSDGGFNWQFSGVVASADEVAYAHEGPSENALAHLANGSVLCVMRVEGESGHHSPYVSKISDDGGRSWKHLRALAAWPGTSWPGEKEATGPGCVRPRLVALNGSLLLSGGRPSPISRDVLVWLNGAGDGEAWRPYSVSYWHNRLVANKSWEMPPHLINDSRALPRFDTSYTSLVRTGSTSAYVLYGAGLRAFAIPFTLSVK